MGGNLRWLTAAEISAGTHWTRSYVYYLASTLRWARQPGRPVRYAAADVYAAIDTLRATRDEPGAPT